MNKSYNYLVKLIPTGKFFFGGEIGYKGRGRVQELTSYIVRSQIFPQQTTLLGALRYALWKLSEKPLNETPIGDTSFHLDNPNKITNFGCIKNLSELYVYHQSQYYWLQPLYNQLAFDGTALQGFDHKKTPPQYFTSFKDCQLKDTLFQSSEQVGVITYASKKRWSMDEDDAFYRQSFYQFKSPDDGFAFLVELDVIEYDKLKEKSLIMPVGGENSLFKVSIESIPADFKQPVFQNEDTYIKIILTSDALLSNEMVEAADFAIADTVDFRFLNTHKKNTKHWYDLKKYDKSDAAENRESPSFSQKYELFARSSVFYFKIETDANKFKTDLEAQTAMRQIGYNQYISQ